jgi:acyl carrier protein
MGTGLEIEAAAVEVIEDQLGLSEGSWPAGLNSHFDDLGADSLDETAILLKLEERFGVEIPDDDTRGWRTVADVVGYIKRRAE